MQLMFPSGEDTIHLPECTSGGSFKPLQCTQKKDFCWCVDDNGQLEPGTKTDVSKEGKVPFCGKPHSEKSLARSMLFYSRNYWQQN